MKLKIDVTEEDIKNGAAGSPGSCPIALACKKAGKPLMIGEREAYASMSDLDQEGAGAVLPLEARQFVFRFDSGAFVSPFSFELEIPE
jgi:hypothetical protein